MLKALKELSVLKAHLTESENPVFSATYSPLRCQLPLQQATVLNIFSLFFIENKTRYFM